jgi:hypothetical protein
MDQVLEAALESMPVPLPETTEEPEKKADGEKKDADKAQLQSN